MSHLGCKVYIKIIPLAWSWLYFYLQANLLKAHFSANLVLLRSQALWGEGKVGFLPKGSHLWYSHTEWRRSRAILSLGLCHHGTLCALPIPGTQGRERTGVWARRRAEGALVTRCCVPLTGSLSLTPSSWSVSHEAGECLAPCIWPWNNVMPWIWVRTCCWLCDWLYEWLQVRRGRSILGAGFARGVAGIGMGLVCGEASFSV